MAWPSRPRGWAPLCCPAPAPLKARLCQVGCVQLEFVVCHVQHWPSLQVFLHLKGILLCVSHQGMPSLQTGWARAHITCLRFPGLRFGAFAARLQVLEPLTSSSAPCTLNPTLHPKKRCVGVLRARAQHPGLNSSRATPSPKPCINQGQRAFFRSLTLSSGSSPCSVSAANLHVHPFTLNPTLPTGSSPSSGP